MLQKWMLSFVLFLTISSANAQFRKIPAVVTDAFRTKFATASAVEWKDRLTAFEANFKVADKDMKASFSSKGDWLKTETKHTYNSLPLDVKDGFKKSKYADLSVIDVTQIDEKERGVLYKVVIRKNEYSKRNLVFSKNGQMVSDNGTL